MCLFRYALVIGGDLDGAFREVQRAERLDPDNEITLNLRNFIEERPGWESRSVSESRRVALSTADGYDARVEIRPDCDPIARPSGSAIRSMSALSRGM